MTIHDMINEREVRQKRKREKEREREREMDRKENAPHQNVIRRWKYEREEEYLVRLRIPSLDETSGGAAIAEQEADD